LVPGSIPGAGATFFKHPQITDTNEFNNKNISNYDTISKNYDTKNKQYLRLYKVSNTYYYRRRIKQKLVRISLRTKSLHIALKRKRTLNLLGDDEMFQLETADLKLAFEYDTEEELRTALEQVAQIQITQKLQHYTQVKEHLSATDVREVEIMTFDILRDKYIARKMADDGVSEDTIGAYNTTFKILIAHFEKRDINELSVDDFDGFKDVLIARKGTNRTRNKHLKMTRQFIRWAVERKFVKENNIQPVQLLSEVKEKQQRKQFVENYTNEEIQEIINYKYKNPLYNTIFKIAVYSGMRQGEIRRLDNNDIIEEDGVHFFNITEAKSIAGVRKVPIHKDILNLVLATSFPLIPKAQHNKNEFGKACRYQLYKVVEKGQGKNFHTLRGTFINRALDLEEDIRNNNLVYIIQDVVGHSKDDDVRLTVDTYNKTFKPEVKQNIVNRVSFN
jgi:integrase